MAELSHDALLAKLLALGPRAPFIALVSAIERLFPDAAALGHTGPYGDEPVHFAHDRNLAFATGDVAEVVRDPHGRVRMTTRFLGLTGSTSPLPFYVAEEVAQEDPEHAHRGAFLDLFHHRLLGLLYRGLVSLDHARAYAADGDDPITRALLALTGLLDRPADDDGFARDLHLRYASLFVSQPGSVEALEGVLADALREHVGDARVEVVCFAGEKVALAGDLLSRLGRNTQLSGGFLLGTRVQARASKLRIRIGPLDTVAYHRLLPEGPAFALVARIVDAVVRDPVDYDLELVLTAGCGRGFRLSHDRLGQMTWLGASPAGARVRVAGKSLLRAA
ncbi:MAG: type VI secretion system baseplate subunit TssG [Polyangiales bacterium]